jgi:hypothetical protein
MELLIGYPREREQLGHCIEGERGARVNSAPQALHYVCHGCASASSF